MTPFWKNKPNEKGNVIDNQAAHKEQKLSDEVPSFPSVVRPSSLSITKIHACK